MAATGKLFLVRHGDAVSRREWPGSDHERPLTDKGRRQAKALARALSRAGPAAIVSSPAVRSVDTVAPLAAACHIAITTDLRLAEAGPADELDDLGIALQLAARADAVIIEALGPNQRIVVCSHGDLIPSWLQWRSGEDGFRLGPPRCAKGSYWEVTFRKGRVVSARYRPPG